MTNFSDLLSACKSWVARRRLFRSGENTGRILFFCAAAFLVYVYGVISADFKLAPYGLFRNAYMAMVTVIERDGGQAEVQDFIYFPQRSDARGVTLHDKGRMQPGYTSLTYFNDKRIFLIDGAGRVIYQYEPRFSEADRKEFGELFSANTRSLDQLQFLHVLKYHIFENGDVLLMLYGAGKRWPIGFGLVKIDRDSNVLWKHITGGIHHDFDIAPDGRIFVLSSGTAPEAPKGLEDLPAPYKTNGVMVLDADGNVIDEIDLYEAIRDSEYAFLSRDANMLSVDRFDHRNDHVHANNIDVLTPEMARNFAFGESGDLLISMRNIHAIGVLNTQKRVFRWLTRGPWIAQHDPDVLDNGNILLYDNSGSDRPGGRSRILEFNPRTMGITWSYDGSEATPFDSDIRGSQQRLANGNTLISESVSGRVFEVTREGEIVWEFHAPFRAGSERNFVPTVRWPQRISEDYFSPEFRAVLEKSAETSELLTDQAAEHATADAAVPQ